MSMSRNYSDTFEGMTATLRYYGMSDTGLITKAVLHQGDFPAVRDCFLQQVVDTANDPVSTMGTSPAVNRSIEDFIHAVSMADDFTWATGSFGVKVINALIEEPSYKFTEQYF